jgi:hypothetical protein
LAFLIVLYIPVENNRENGMKVVLGRAIFKAACSFLVIFVLLTVLQYVAWCQPGQNIIVYIDYPSAAAERYEIHNSEDLFLPWFLYFWPFNHPDGEI